MTRTDQLPEKVLTVLLHAVFFLSGITTVLIGQILPILTARFELNDLESGYFFPAQFTGSITGTLVTNWFARGGRLVSATALGSALMAVGLLTMSTGSYEIVLLGFLVNGLGIGLTLPAINVLILERRPESSAAALTFLNFFWGLGAIVSKPFVDATSGGSDLFLTIILLAVPLAAAALLAVVLPARTEARVESSPERTEELIPVWSTTAAWAIAGFAFIHVGFESGMGGWLTTYAGRVDADTSFGLISPTFLYFLFFVIGRGIGPAFFRFLDENRMLLASLGTILAGLIIALGAEGLTGLSIGASICGLGTSTIFPTNVSRFSKTFGPEAMRRATPLFISGTLGGSVVTWLIGFLSNRTGSLRSGMFVLLASIILLIGLQAILSVRAARPAGRPIA